MTGIVVGMCIVDLSKKIYGRRDDEVEAMKIYIIVKNNSDKKTKIFYEFNSNLLKELQQYGVEFTIVNCNNYGVAINGLEEESLIILYNNETTHNTEERWITKFIDKAIKYSAQIWPVAINKKCRKPNEKYETKQSFDVWEQLRCRNLDENYVKVVAKVFSRQIIEYVYPTMYRGQGEIFLSHRRIDGEEIIAKIHDKMSIMAKDSRTFRDVVNVKVGENAQSIIDQHMENSDVFVFLHTPKSANSDWILKELLFALLRNIPIVWVNIDGADFSTLKVRPSDKPHLFYASNDFNDDSKLVQIVDEIFDVAFKVIMRCSNSELEYSELIRDFFGDKVTVCDQNRLIYHITMPRKGYFYPQRNIEQYYQIFGRTPTRDDEEYLKKMLKDKGADSVAILTNKLISFDIKNEIVFDSPKNFYMHWKSYLNESNDDNNSNMEIVISGAFPDSDEIYKQSLTDALIHFSRAILRNGYRLTFGSHPSFQQLLFDVAREERPNDYRQRLNMYISNWFLNSDVEKEKEYRGNCTLNILEQKGDLLQSLTEMRKGMLQRLEVKALICLGGKVKKSKLEEGVREEIDLARKYDIPVFIVGSVGGCSSIVASEYKESGWDKINGAPEQLNEQFYQDIDYYKIAQNMLDYIKKMS